MQISRVRIAIRVHITSQCSFPISFNGVWGYTSKGVSGSRLVGVLRSDLVVLIGFWGFFLVVHAVSCSILQFSSSRSFEYCL